MWWGRRVANWLIATLTRLGLVPSGTVLLTTRGRRTGKPRTTPVYLTPHEGDRWLVAPYGEVAWVHNVRASGEAETHRGRTRERVRLEEVDAATAAPVLRAYLRRAPVVKPYFDAGLTSPLEAFEAEADRHPVFRVTEARRL